MTAERLYQPIPAPTAAASQALKFTIELMAMAPTILLMARKLG